MIQVVDQVIVMVLPVEALPLANLITSEVEQQKIDNSGEI